MRSCICAGHSVLEKEKNPPAQVGLGVAAIAATGAAIAAINASNAMGLEIVIGGKTFGGKTFPPQV